MVQLLGLDLWQQRCATQKEIADKITKKLVKDTKAWIDAELAKIEERSVEIKDKVVPEIERLISKLP